MGPLAAAKLWLAIRPIRRLKQAKRTRKARKAHKAAPIVTDEQTEAEVKEFIARKAKGAIKSSTVGVAGLIVTAGIWMQANPEIIGAVVPDGFEGVTLAVVGLFVAIARLRTAGK